MRWLRRIATRRVQLLAAWVVAAAVVWVAADHLMDMRSSRRVAGMRLLAPGDLEVDFAAGIAQGTQLESAGVSFPEGWVRAGRWGLWAVGRRAVIDFLVDAPRDRSLTLNCRAYPGIPEDVEQRVAVSLNGDEQGSQVVEQRWHRLELRLPAGAQHAGVNRVELSFAVAVKPLERDAGATGRPIAFGVRGISLGGDGRGGVAVQGLSHLAVPGNGARHLAPVLLRGSGTLVASLELGGDERWLEVSLRHPMGTPLSSAALVPRAFAGGGRELEPRPLELTAGSRTAARRYPLAGVGRGWLGASFDVTSDAPLQVSVRAVDAVATVDTPPHREAATARPPDIVVVILDAARRDHFGCYGYPRRTTPRIDALAREALVFDDVSALAPYTLCSVPTMLTGTSFLAHGVVEHGDRLADEVVTLAETLRDRGYETAAFSSSPNNSRALGFDQGFETFVETWTKVQRGRQSRDPFRLTHEVLGWLRQRHDPRPLFLLVHYIPPHEPYDPEPRFDVFSDPAYDGPVDGAYPVLRKIDRGAIEATPADLRHIRDLYDGNLLRADAALGPLLVWMRQSTRWDETVMLVTADHGEAMVEHGRTTHNSTVYEEMLAVPFILRLPPGMRSDSVDRHRLGNLADLAPTLAGLAGTELPGSHLGVDLLEPGSAGPNRAFVLRTTGKPPVFGVRTARWKAVLTQYQTGELYDLQADPAERDNLVLRRFDLFSALEALAVRRLNAKQDLAADERRDELGDTEREMLRELGYLQ